MRHRKRCATGQLQQQTCTEHSLWTQNGLWSSYVSHSVAVLPRRPVPGVPMIALPRYLQTQGRWRVTTWTLDRAADGGTGLSRPAAPAPVSDGAPGAWPPGRFPSPASRRRSAPSTAATKRTPPRSSFLPRLCAPCPPSARKPA